MSSLTAITSMTGATPEQKFLAAMLSEAVTEARAGCPLAHAWLAHIAPDYLSWFCSGEISPEILHSRLLSLLRTTRPAPTITQAICLLTTQTAMFSEQEAA